MYQKTIDSLKAIGTIATHMKNLGKIMNETEDSQLKSLIENTIGVLQAAHSNPKVKSKSTPGNLYNTNKPSIKLLVQYCEQFIKINKPEWQVLAERNGWTPPAP